ncbi:mating-type-like pheromone receptor [Phlebiopsis gigantea 11061_1 CR5-6]|uniref:Mating-type-like pheromone receptor n=1 Tax=Phlebiopsis gigantea (strain 11061_1 CR5-6) TaxID=745531 RepID=A0A0C3NBK7_PHLG1|nr:mating-type-like pheromone receptor [Phlebiopsis gigantea 11061_1 CR5-6]
MRPELAILSFLCLVLLIALTLLHVNSRNVAVLSLIGWLLASTLVQGVNSIVWAQSTEIRSPVWCDIASKFLLGARTALPAACFCIIFHLYFLSSNRNAKRRRYRTIFELIFCLLVPLVYMALHIIVQTYRFDLAQGFGCVASIYPSTTALILVWMPPMLFCMSALSLASLTLWSHIRRSQQLSDRACLSSRLITVTFLRPLFTAIIISLLIFVVSLFDMTSALMAAGGLQSWTSLSATHAEIAQVRIVPNGDISYLERIEAWWWVVPISTLVFSLLALAGLAYCAAQGDSGLGYQSPGRWLRSSFFRRSSSDDEFIQGSDGYSTRFSTRFTISSPPPLTPVVLSSGWDDSLRPSKIRPKPTPIVLPVHSPSPSETGSESAASSKSQALAYLQSPASPDSPVLAAPAPVAESHRWTTLLTTSPPTMSQPLPTSHKESILSAPWPVPPSTVPVSPVKGPALSPVPTSRHYLRPPSISSITTSMASSTISASAYLSDPDVFLHTSHRAPFRDAGIPTTAVPPPTVQRVPRRIHSLESFHGRKLSLASVSGGAKRRERDGRGEAIYMTVVQETV